MTSVDRLRASLHHKILTIVIASFALCGSSLFPDLTHASTHQSNVIVITSPSDSGDGSLRAALGQARKGDTLRFDTLRFPSTAPVTITLFSNLPEIEVDGLVIDASDSYVILDGREIPTLSQGLRIYRAKNIVVMGLTISGFDSHGIGIAFGSDGVTIGGRRDIGASPLGQGNAFCGNRNGISISSGSHQIIGNNFGGNTSVRQVTCRGNDNGVVIDGSPTGSVIGDSDPNLSNVFGFNDIGLNLQQSSNNKVLGNSLGVGLYDAAMLGNANGISVVGGIGNVIGGHDKGAGNTIGASTGSGLSVLDTEGLQIIGNMIGTDRSGSMQVPNWKGIYIRGGVSGSRGDGVLISNNVISGNYDDGIELDRLGVSVAQPVRIEGNTIGLSADHSAVLGNGGPGISLIRGSHGHTIGGEDASAGNTIAGNGGDAIAIIGDGSSDNRVVGNSLGVMLGAKPIGNGGYAIRVDGDAGGNTITHNQAIGNAHGMRVDISDRWADNHLSGGGKNLIEISGGTLESTSVQWQAQGDAKTIQLRDESVTIPAEHSLSIDPGMRVELDYGLGIFVQGEIHANGTRHEPIMFTAASPYSHPLPGDWLGFSFPPGGKGRFQHAAIEFAATGVGIDGGDVAMRDAVVTASREAGIELVSGRVQLADMSLAGNIGYAIHNHGTEPLRAEGTWWGSKDGPRTDSRPDTAGDRVAGPIAFETLQGEPTPPRTGSDVDWAFAPVLNPGAHSGIASIAEGRDFRWYRVPVGTRGASIAASVDRLAADFDLFLFHGLARGPSSPEGIGPSSPEGIGPSSPEGIGPGDLMGIAAADAGGDRPCPAGYLGELARLGIAANTSQIVASSCRLGTTAERVAIDTWDQSGWYHVLVAPHNGARAADRPFDLRVEVRPGLASNAADLGTSGMDQPEVDPDARTLLIWAPSRLTARYGRERVLALDAKVRALAVHAAVRGRIVEVDLVPSVGAAYRNWDADSDNPKHANIAAAAVRSALLAYAAATPSLAHIVLIGDDDAIPFHRVPDETLLSNERTYPTAGFTESAPRVAAGMREGYFLSDDPYASVAPLPYRGRSLPQPAFGLGRLVESPEDIAQAIDSFMGRPTVDVTAGLVTGYDFLTDMSSTVADTLGARGLQGDALYRLIDDLWTPEHFLRAWRTRRHDILSLNAHFTHHEAQAAQPDRSGNRSIRPADLAAGGALAQTVVFTVGCHSGLSVPAGATQVGTDDFAQVAVANGAAYLANTGFGYGDADTIAYSERLMTLFVEHLTRGRTTGDALRLAKLEYLNSLGLQSLTPYDEKILGIATLYGMPMLQVKLPATTSPLAEPRDDGPRDTRDDRSERLGPLEPCMHGLGVLCRTASLSLTYEGPVRPGELDTGAYFRLAGETTALPGRPISARTSISITHAGVAARGVFFDGGRYRTIQPFDPVIARTITDTTTIPLWQSEPRFDQPGWTRTQWALVNTVGYGGALRQKLVVTPEQYRPLDGRVGVLRQLDAITYTLYYSNHADTLPPSVWSVQAHMDMGNRRTDLTVDATDFSDVIRVAVTYTDGKGGWHTTDLTHASEDRWTGTLPAVRGLEYFVQAVDAVGNVGFNDNKGRYFTLSEAQVTLPWVGRSATEP